MFSLAYAEARDNSNAALLTVLLSLGIVAGVAIAAAVPAIIARRRRPRAAGGIAGLAFLWALASGGLGLFSLFAGQQWNKEEAIRIQSGYYDPRAAGPSPSLHPLGWAILAVVYIALVAASWHRPAPPAPLSAE